jgi:hypothetical protein
MLHTAKAALTLNASISASTANAPLARSTVVGFDNCICGHVLRFCLDFHIDIYIICRKNKNNVTHRKITQNTKHDATLFCTFFISVSRPCSSLSFFLSLSPLPLLPASATVLGLFLQRTLTTIAQLFQLSTFPLPPANSSCLYC